MSYFNDTILSDDLQEYLAESLEKLAERVTYKEEIKDLMQKVLDEKMFEYFSDCGKYLRINEHDEIISGNFCKNRLCPVCNRRYSAQKWRKVKFIAEKLKSDLKPVFAFLTLTVKNVPENKLSAEITHLMKSIDRLHKRKTFKENVLGYFRSLEVTYNSETQTYHPHYHYVLALIPNYNKEVSTYEWRRMWEESARLDYVSQIDIKIITEENNQLSDAIAEVAKYAVKISSVIKDGSEAIKPLVKAIKGRRLISFGGCIADYAKEYENAEDNKKQTTTFIQLFYDRGTYKTDGKEWSY